MPQITPDDVSRVAKDAVYVGVGLGVIGFQRAQVQRVELTKALKSQAGGAREQLDKASGAVEEALTDLRSRFEGLAGSVDDRVKLVEERLDAVEGRLDAVLDEIEAKLPEPAREIVQQARDAAREARQQVRSVVGRAA